MHPRLQMPQPPAIVWFRHDLRTADNPALRAAAEHGGPVIPVFIWAPEEEGDWPPGAASRWWLHRSLQSLEQELKRLGAPLILQRGGSLATLKSLIKETGADAVFWNRRYEPATLPRDAQIQQDLRQSGVHAESFNADLLFKPGEIRTKMGGPYKVFTPFWRACLAAGDVVEPAAAPAMLRAPPLSPASVALADLSLEPRIPWDAGLRRQWSPGTAGAAAQLRRFLDEAVFAYAAGRDRPDQSGTSCLSPHLRFGEIGPRQVWHAVRAAARRRGASGDNSAAEPYLRQLIWREFAAHLLYHFPSTPKEPLRPEFEHFPWINDGDALRAWQRGRTGYPYVDAGMRQLWATGWMHNRVRMMAGSMLVKDLLLPWQAGAAWFWDTLVDADLANNTLGWQWIAGCGADAAPYFRIFNPLTQAERFDPQGTYVRTWVPELKALPDAWIQKPWQAPREVLQAAGVELGVTYPRPIVNHDEARKRALAALATLPK